MPNTSETPATGFDEARDGPVAAAAGRGLEIAGLNAVRVEDGANVEALHEILAPVDVMGKFVQTRLDVSLANIAVRQPDPVKRNIARPRELDHLEGGLLFLGSSGHGGHLRDGRS